MNNQGISRRCFTETDVKDFKSGVLRTITNITRSILNWKKQFLQRCISKILFIDTEKLTQMQISLQMFFKDFADRFRMPYLKNEFFWSCFLKIFSIDFRIATNLKNELSKNRVSPESWESWESWEIEQTFWESHGISFFFEKSWKIHEIFISCILENSIWLLLNTLLEVFVAESIKLTLFTCKD